MNRYKTYMRFKKGEITIEEVAKELNLTVKDMKFKISRLGARLPVILKTLDRIEEDKISRDEAAELLGVGVRQINFMMTRWGVQRPMNMYLVKRTVSKVKWEVRKNWAIDFIAGSMTIEEAAETAGVSARQMRRWVSNLLDKHYGMVFKDLKTLSAAKLKRLADEIETAEGLELAKQQVIKSISSGEKTLEEEALARVMAKRTRRRLNV